MSSPAATLGVVETVFHRLVSCCASVHSIEPVAEVFRLVTLAGKDLRDRRWSPGDIIQIGFPGMVGRAYTPHVFDAVRGTLSFVGYLHGQGGPAVDWLATTQVGDSLFFVGPRRALALDTLSRPMFFFGDETSLSTAAALHATREGTRGVTFAFEVNDVARARAVLDHLGVRDAIVLARDAADRHLETLVLELQRALRAAPDLRCAFTGKAASIQLLYKAARRAGLSSKRVTNVAYWAPGRKGFSGVQR